MNKSIESGIPTSGIGTRRRNRWLLLDEAAQVDDEASPAAAIYSSWSLL